MIKKLPLLLVLSFCFLLANSQQSSTKYLKDYIRVWGFLKYYHPAIGGGRVDADSFFLRYVPKILTVADKKSYGEVLQTMQQELGTVTGGIAPDTAKLFVRNDRTAWINNDKLLPARVKEELKLLRRNGYTDSIHRYMPATFFETEIPAEKQYDSIQFPNIEYQLLALGRYWNAIEYLFPYKYMISRSWDNVLDEQIAAFAKPMTQVQFEQHLLQLNAAIEDTHGGIIFIKQSGSILGSFFPPFLFRFAGDSIVVTDYLDSLSCTRQNIRKGDIITGVRGKTIAQAIASCNDYVSASNLHKKKSLLASIPLLQPLRGKDSLISIQILKKGVAVTAQLLLQKPTGKEFLENLNRLYQKQTGMGTSTQNNFVLKSLNKDIALLDAANLSILYNQSADDRAIDSVILAMRQHNKAILLDLRCYATQAVFYNKFLPALGRKLKPFAVLQAPYNRFPGTYYVKDIFSPVTQPLLASPYTGKLILLVNEQTQSQSELITMIMQASGPVTVVGTQTAGCDGDLIYMPIPGGYSLSFSGRHVAYPDGTASQKNGVKRDIKIRYSVQGIASDRDEILEAALRLVK